MALETLIASAMVADNRLSSAANAATATAGATSVRRSMSVNVGRLGSGSVDGNAPMVATSRCATCTSSVAATTAISATGTAGLIRGDARQRSSPRDPAASSAGTHCGAVSHWPTARTATMTTCSPAPVTPKAAGTCCRAMITRDAERESLDDGQRDEAHVAPQPHQRHDHEEGTGHQTHNQDTIGAVLRHDRHQNDGHGARGTGDLDVAPRTRQPPCPR